MSNKKTVAVTIPIDLHKKNALLRLAAKKEKWKNYPVNTNDLLKISVCPLCKSGDISLISEIYLKRKFVFFATSTCNHCLFSFRSVSPKLSWFQKCWKRIHNGKLEVFNPSVEELRKQRYQQYLDLLLKYIKGKNLLDIGAAYGTGADLFRANGFDVEAVEPEISKKDYLEKFHGIPVVASSIEKFVTKKRNYDLIIFAQCLEHIDKPAFTIRRIKNLLKPVGGVLYVEIPILWKHTQWNESLYMAHKSNFTEENIIDLLEKSGFKILDKFYLDQHSKETPCDLGLICIYTGNHKSSLVFSKSEYSVNDVKMTYRRNFPATPPPLEKVIRFTVPYIEQFFQIVNLANKIITSPKSSSGFMSFKIRKP